MVKIEYEDKETKDIVKENSNKKIYRKIIETISLIGECKENIKLSTYLNVNSNEEKMIELCSFDDVGNMFVFCIDSSKREKIGIINHYDNKDTYIYDVKLSKNYEITKDNYQILRNNMVINFKLGRVITDNKTYCNILFGDNITYVIDVDCKKIDSVKLMKQLNSLEQKPDFIWVVRILESCMNIENTELDNLSIKTYKDFKMIGEFSVLDNENNRAKICN